jgi:hypothetical protein
LKGKFMSDDIQRCLDDPACDPIEKLFAETRLAISAIRRETEVAIDAIHDEMGISNDKGRDGRAVRDMAEAVRRERQRVKEANERDVGYDSNERRHREGR